MDSFITWVGGKRILRKKIVEQFPTPKTYHRYIEVFEGAGWVLFFAEKHANLEVYNDVNGQLVNLFRCIKYHSKTVQEELQFILMSREQFFDAKSQVDIRGMTDIQRAARFFILIKESFGASASTFGLKSRDIEKAKDYLSIISKRLNQVVIENLDFQAILKTYDKEDALFYLDPPYYQVEKYYSEQFFTDDHVRLKIALDKIKGKFVLSYNDCEYIRNLYKEYTILAVERENNLSQAEKKPSYKELIIKNF